MLAYFQTRPVFFFFLAVTICYLINPKVQIYSQIFFCAPIHKSKLNKELSFIYNMFLVQITYIFDSLTLHIIEVILYFLNNFITEQWLVETEYLT